MTGYIEKPFSLPVLEARIMAALKRYYGDYNIFRYNEAEVNFTSYRATYMKKEVNVNAKEFEILKTLLRNKNKVLTRNQIMDNVWNENDEIPYDRVIDVYIKELRKKLGLDCIKTVRSVGYKLVLDEEN